MSAQAVEEVLRQARDDTTFRQRLQHDPDGALHGFDIEYAERQAIISGDETKLRQFGVAPDLAAIARDVNPVRQDPTE